MDVWFLYLSREKNVAGQKWKLLAFELFETNALMALSRYFADSQSMCIYISIYLGMVRIDSVCNIMCEHFAENARQKYILVRSDLVLLLLFIRNFH